MTILNYQRASALALCLPLFLGYASPAALAMTDRSSPLTPFPPSRTSDRRSAGVLNTGNDSTDGNRAALVAQDYVLGPGDRVKVEVFKVPQYSLETQVLVDGSVSLLQAGRIQVQGLTLEQASASASRQYSRLLKYPTVTVTLVAPRPIRVGIAGEVTRRGSYDLSVSAELNNTAAVQLPTITRALKVAGGITQSADLRQVQIRRLSNRGGDETITLDLLEYVRGSKPREDIVLRDGDAIFVPTADQVGMRESYELATTSFSATQIQPLNVTVVGEVYRPGTHTVESNVQIAQAGAPGTPRDAFNQTRTYPTITRAIQTAGGIKPMADTRMVQLKRTAQNGTERTYNVDLWKLLTVGDQEQDLLLQDRDTIVVPTAKSVPSTEMSTLAAASFSPDKITVNVVGEVERPGTIQVPPNTPLNKAILAAGGFNRRADKNVIEFVRLNPDGTAIKQTMPFNITQGIDEKTNPSLRNEDVIVVKRSGYSQTVDEAGNVFNPLGAIVSVFNAIFRR